MKRYRILLKKQVLAVLEIEIDLLPEFATMTISQMLREAKGDVWMLTGVDRPVAFEANSDWQHEKCVRVCNPFGDYQTFTFEEQP